MSDTNVTKLSTTEESDNFSVDVNIKAKGLDCTKEEYAAELMRLGNQAIVSSIGQLLSRLATIIRVL